MKSTLEKITQKIYFEYLFISISILKLLYTPLVTADVFIWIASGLKIFDKPTLLFHENYSIHSNLEFLYPAHFSNLLYAIVFNLGGPLLVFFFLRFVGILFVFYIYQKYMSRVAHHSFNLIMGIFFVVGSFYMLDRPAYLAFIPASLFIEELFQKRSKVNNFLYFYFILLIWTNIHSSSLVALILLGVRIIFSLNVKNLIRLMGAFLGVLSTPIGYKIFPYAMQTMEKSSIRFVGEWDGIFGYKDGYCTLLYLVFILVLIFQLIKKNQLLNYIKSGLFIFPLLCLSSARHIILFSISLFATYHHFDLWINKKNITNSFFKNGIVMLSILFLSLFLVIDNYNKNNFFDQELALDLVEHLKDKINLRVFNDSDGGVISAHLAKNNIKIFFDNRNIVFTDEIYSDFYKMKHSQSVDLIISKYNLNAIIVSNKNLLLLKEMSKKEKWKKEFVGVSLTLFLLK